MAAPNPSRLDANQVLQGSFDEETGSLRTTSNATVVNSDIDVALDATEDNVAAWVKDEAGNPFTDVNYVPVGQSTHDNLNLNANVQQSNADVGILNPLYTQTTNGALEITQLLNNTELVTLNSKIVDNYGASTGAVRTASQIGNSTGAADFNTGLTTAQTLRVSANTTGVNPSGSQIPLRAGGEDLNNTTTTPLGIGATFTGTFTDCLNFACIDISLKADVDSAIDGVKIQFSNDGINIVREQVTTYIAPNGIYASFPTETRYFRFIYTNGTVAQTQFVMEIHLHTESQSSQVVPIGYPLKDEYSASLNRSIITGKSVDGEYINQRASGVSSQNSSIINLLAGATFTGVWEDVLGFSNISVNIYTDVDSAIDGLKIEFSNDGITAHTSDVYTIYGNSGAQYTFGVSSRYARVRYVNGAVNQSIFSLSTLYHITSPKPSSQRIADVITGQHDAELSKAVLTGESSRFDGNYKNVTTTQYGDLNVNIQGVSIDRFGRLRVSNVSGIFEHKQTLTNCPCILQNVTNGVGATITYDKNNARSILQVGSAAGEYQIQQTMRYFPYIPGKSQLILQTGNLRGHEVGVEKNIGYYDDRNGLGWRSNGSTLCVFRRYYNTGVAQEEVVTQANFNVDKLDGTGPSRIIFDPTKTQIFGCTFQWLGVGEVLFFISAKSDTSADVLIPVHLMDHANIETVVYMSTPTLPVRYEIRKLAATTGPHYMDSICMSVATEGGLLPQGREYSVSTGWGAGRTVTTTRTPIFAVRLMNTFQGDLNRLTARFVDWATFTYDRECLFEIEHVHAPNFGAATWAPVGGATGTSACEYSTDLTQATDANSVTKIISQNFESAAKGGGGGASLASDYVSTNRFLSQNYNSTASQAFVIYATATTVVNCGMTWIEFD